MCFARSLAGRGDVDTMAMGDGGALRSPHRLRLFAGETQREATGESARRAPAGHSTWRAARACRPANSRHRHPGRPDSPFRIEPHAPCVCHVCALITRHDAVGASVWRCPGEGHEAAYRPTSRGEHGHGDSSSSQQDGRQPAEDATRRRACPGAAAPHPGEPKLPRPRRRRADLR